jgi:hypothetical protein
LSATRICCASAPILLAEGQEATSINVTLTQTITVGKEGKKIQSRGNLWFTQYYASLQIQIFPASGPTYGNTLVKITGLAFTIRGLEALGVGFTLVVRFDKTEVVGEVVGDVVTCIAPSRDANIDTIVKVSISLGIDKDSIADASFFITPHHYARKCKF